MDRLRRRLGPVLARALRAAGHRRRDRRPGPRARGARGRRRDRALGHAPAQARRDAVRARDPSLMEKRADSLFDYAVSVSGCQQPLIALNELWGASLPTPLTPTAEQYRANVLRFVSAARASAAPGPALLVSSEPYTAGDAAAWWRSVGQRLGPRPRELRERERDLANGAVDGSRTLRDELPRSAASCFAVGVPASPRRAHDRVPDRRRRRRARGPEAALALVRRREVAGVRGASRSRTSSGSRTSGRGAGRSGTRAPTTPTRPTPRASGCGRASPGALRRARTARQGARRRPARGADRPPGGNRAASTTARR